jgi:ubiquinone/menaquinone biosynthesis C-methylase UbiE
VVEDKRIRAERRFWDRFAPRYDTFVDRRVESYQTLLGKIYQEVDKGMNVLEVAAGTGLIALRVARRADFVCAVDISPAMITEARKKVEAGRIDNVTFLVNDAYSLSLDSDVFDVTICSNALHNMKTPRAALLEMRRVLKAGGKVVTPTFCHGEGFKSRSISTLMGLTGFPAFQRFTIEMLTELIESAGFTITKKEVLKDSIPMAFIVGKKQIKGEGLET